MRTKFYPYFFALFFLASAARAALGPVGPSADVVSKSKNPSGKNLNLPYKPVPEDEDESFDLGDNAFGNPDKPAEIKIDWATVPYVPFKRVPLDPAPEPAWE